MLLRILFPFSALLSPCFSLHTPSPQYRTIYQFQDGTFIENIAVRSTGELLLTSVMKPVIFNLDPFSPHSEPSILFEFTDATGTTGITEVIPDVFAVLTGVIDVAKATAEKGSMCLWTIDLRATEPVEKKIVCIPDSTILNGATTLTSTPGTVLVSDSHLGAVYRINVDTGNFTVTLQDSLLTNTTGSAIGLGINGIRMFGSTLYFANSDQGFFGSVPLSATGDPEGAIQTIARVPSGTNFTAYDDFAIDAGGNAWVTLHQHALVVITPEGKQRVVIGGGNSTFLSDPTSAAFGRGKESEEKTLYVVTGGLNDVGGQVVAVKL